MHIPSESSRFKVSGSLIKLLKAETFSAVSQKLLYLLALYFTLLALFKWMEYYCFLLLNRKHDILGERILMERIKAPVFLEAVLAVEII